MNSKRMWMVRAGEGGLMIDEFRTESWVGIGWTALGDMNRLQSRADFTEAVAQSYPSMKLGQRASSAGQSFRFVREIALGDDVITYDRGERTYVVGEVTGEYEHRGAGSGEYPNIRRVRWQGTVTRDAL